MLKAPATPTDPRGVSGDLLPETDVMRILIADDDAVGCALLQLTLERQGHTVEVATGGRDAVELATAMLPDLVILDVTMPGLDGLEVTRRLRARPRTAQLPIVLLTGRDTDPDIVAGWQSGADYYVTKPFDVEGVLYLIDTLYDSPQPEASPSEEDSVVFRASRLIKLNGTWSDEPITP
jgi:DNA-binding response OmpR family regulator